MERLRIARLAVAAALAIGCMERSERANDGTAGEERLSLRTWDADGSGALDPSEFGRWLVQGDASVLDDRTFAGSRFEDPLHAEQRLDSLFMLWDRDRDGLLSGDEWRVPHGGVVALSGDAYGLRLIFSEPISDSVLARMLARHGVEPFAVYAVAGGVTGAAREPFGSASLELLGRAREDLSANLQIELCGRQSPARLGIALREPGLDAERALLAAVEQLRDAVVRVERGQEAVYAVDVVGLRGEVAALGTPAGAAGAGPPDQGRPPPLPTALDTLRTSEEIAALSPAAVEVRFRELSEPSAPCEASPRAR